LLLSVLDRDDASGAVYHHEPVDDEMVDVSVDRRFRSEAESLADLWVRRSKPVFIDEVGDESVRLAALVIAGFGSHTP